MSQVHPKPYTIINAQSTNNISVVNMLLTFYA